jgi:hypothetical protein
MELLGENKVGRRMSWRRYLRRVGSAGGQGCKNNWLPSVINIAMTTVNSYYSISLTFILRSTSLMIIRNDHKGSSHGEAQGSGFRGLRINVIGTTMLTTIIPAVSILSVKITAESRYPLAASFPGT